MLRYFYRIWDKFRYKYDDKSEIIAALMYTYKENIGFIYNMSIDEIRKIYYEQKCIEQEIEILRNLIDNK